MPDAATSSARTDRQQCALCRAAAVAAGTQRLPPRGATAAAPMPLDDNPSASTATAAPVARSRSGERFAMRRRVSSSRCVATSDRRLQRRALCRHDAQHRLRVAAESFERLGRRAGGGDQVGHRSRSKNFWASWLNAATPLGTGRRRNPSVLPHREPRAGGSVAGPRADGEVAHHRQSRAGPAAARLC